MYQIRNKPLLTRTSTSSWDSRSLRIQYPTTSIPNNSQNPRNPSVFVVATHANHLLTGKARKKRKNNNDKSCQQ